MMEKMKFASLLAKLAPAKSNIWGQALDIASRVAADKISAGRLADKGRTTTDIILFDTSRPEFVPGFNPHSDIVYAANGYSVDTVICIRSGAHGEWIRRGGKEMMEAARKVAENTLPAMRLVSRCNARQAHHRRLRLLGFDTDYAKSARCAWTKIRRAEGDRVLLTRRSTIEADARSIRIESEQVAEQLREIKGLVGPAIDKERIFRRCTECNAELVEIDKTEIESPARVCLPHPCPFQGLPLVQEGLLGGIAC